ncbi:amino acid ABC transporter [Rhizobium phaseoli]|uniref:amino acid ABC transporter permease n=1 Tax=Rhizobium phaseoli TaxID=396 RepID=UPI0003181571|nr:amino acid ABC transporter permease [Rhizobium phaseoli]KKZ87072.1 amino acid ABC transporter permease [Rhizobium phaseoli Ch24-10]RDJ13246.1 amino acid ABC transporter [Rhizobium phaseoli]RDJ16388.1 amino acid ABC transporter [Rhizobium phaseoli]
MTTVALSEPRKSGHLLRNIGFAALPALILLWSLADLTLGRELVEWLPYLASGFLMNVVISLSAMTLGTVVGTVLGILQLVPYRPVRYPVVAYVQAFRNAPHLVLIFATTYIFPFEIVVFGNYLPFPDWLKAVIGLAIPASAYVAEITRGAILSIPTTQWEAAKGLGFSRSQALRWIILPQCLRRSLPPWMNILASITMGTSLASLVGVHELLHAATDASTAVRRLDFTIIAYIVVMAAFFTLCYPIARLTRRLERRFNAGSRI